MSAFWLKVIAAAAMLTDHIGALFFPQTAVLRIAGRLAFPIYAFLAAEGAAKTRHPCRYLARLGAFALLSELPFRLAFSISLNKPALLNVLFTLFAGAACCMVCSVQKALPSFCFILSAAAAAQLSGSDYGAYGVLCIVCFYLLRREKAGQGIVFALLTAFNSILVPAPLQAFAVLGLAPCALYSGERGRDLRWLFYAFYPAHLLLLWAVRLIV